jgi:RimJ/RimL family protein N-acetyltransferase
MLIETARLLLRPPCLADAPALFAFLGDATAMQYTTPQASLWDCQRYLAAHERQRRRIGCAPWVVVERETKATIGFGGLYDDPFDRGWGVEVGISLRRRRGARATRPSSRSSASRWHGNRRAGRGCAPSRIQRTLLRNECC